MRVFVTGATGFIGSALIPQLLAAGHQVVGLARSEASAQALRAAGAEAVVGSLEDLDILKKAAQDSDGVIHLAFRHDIAFSGGFEEAAQSDLKAVQALGEGLAGTGRPLVIASGLQSLKPGEMATEHDFPALEGNPMVTARARTARAALDLAEQGVRSSVLRMAPTNHGEGDHGFVAQLVALARQKGVSAYIGDGQQRWSATHRLDTAELFRLALEKAPAGSVLHGAAEGEVKVRDIAEAIGRQLNVPTVSLTPEQGAEHFGWLMVLLATDSPISSTVTRELVGWNPSQPGLIADIEQGHYSGQ